MSALHGPAVAYRLHADALKTEALKHRDSVERGSAVAALVVGVLEATAAADEATADRLEAIIRGECTGAQKAE